MVPGKKVQLGQGHNCRVFTYVRGHINLLKMSAFCRFKLLVLSLLWQLDYYRSRKGAIIFVKTDGVCCQLFVQSQAYGERISDCVCTSTLNPILGLFKQQAKGNKRMKLVEREKKLTASGVSCNALQLHWLLSGLPFL